jgi:hypothetical protein
MSLRSAATKVSVLMLLCISGFTGAVFAVQEDSLASGVPMPVIPMGQGDTCVEDTDFMRRNHMDMLKHQRDETMIEGLRGEQYSLKECIACHVVFGPDSKPVTVSSPQHFCRSCHDYAAVSIDCFQCHASRPDASDSFAGQQPSVAFPTTTTVNGSQ